jgi:hypothetical protein
MMRVLLVCWLFFATIVSAAPITVLIGGNFGSPTSGSTVLDNQNYSISFTVPDPLSPDMSGSFGNAANATYHVPAQLSISGLGFSVTTTVDADYRSDPSTTMGMWLNLFTFSAIPVAGEFMVMTPLTTIGAPLWNGLAGALGTPEVFSLSSAPSYARFFVEQPGPMGPIPVAVYEDQTSSITQTIVPEPSSMALIGIAFAAGLGRKLFRTEAPQ